MAKNKEKISNFINRLLITGLLTIIILIVMKKNDKVKSYFIDKVMGTNFNFAYINELYTKYFGNSFYPQNLLDDAAPVFNEKLEFTNKNQYLDGVELIVSNDYLVPTIDSGMVVFIGEKEGYGNVVIVQQVNGIDVWYGNITNVGVNLYDYVTAGSLIGNCNNNLYLVFKKDGNVLNYEDYI